MKRLLSLAISLGIILSACNGTSISATSNTDIRVIETEYEASNKISTVQADIVYERLFVYKFDTAITCVYLVEIKNVGTVNCFVNTSSLDLEDSNGDLITTVRLIDAEPRILMPGDSSYATIAIDLSETSIESIDQVGQSLLHYETSKLASEPEDFSKVTIDSLRLEIAKDGWPHVIGRIENNSTSTKDFLHYVWIIRDENGTLLSSNFGIITDLKPGERKGFDDTVLYGDHRGDYSTANVEVVLG